MRLATYAIIVLNSAYKHDISQFTEDPNSAFIYPSQQQPWLDYAEVCPT